MLLLHGDNTIGSRKELEILKEKNKDKEIIVLDGKSLDLTQLKGALEAKSLFKVDKLVIIENFLSKLRTKNQGPKTKNLELEYLLKQQDDKNLIIWEGKEITKGVLSFLKNAKIKIFKVEKLVFSLVEALRPDNTKKVVNLYRQCLLTNSVEAIFPMIIRQFRLLILIKSEAKTGPNDFLRLAPWQKQRLTNQAKFFTIEVLEEIYQKLLEIDYKNKTGRAVFNLERMLELFLINL